MIFVKKQTEPITITRNADGFFKCPEGCNSQYESPQAIKKHLMNCGKLANGRQLFMIDFFFFVI